MSASRYVGWQARDYLTQRAPLPVLLVFLLLAALTADARYRAHPDTFLDDPTSAFLVRTVLVLFCLCMVLFASKGIVSDDRTSGAYRLLFAKQVNIVRFYLLSFALRGVLVSGICGIVVLAATLVFHNHALWTLVLAGPFLYVMLGGTGFLLSTLTNNDAAYLLFAVVGGHLAYGRLDAVAYLLPPVWIFKSFVSLTRTGPIMPTAGQFLWAFIYGFIALILGVYALATRRFRA